MNLKFKLCLILGLLELRSTRLTQNLLVDSSTSVETMETLNLLSKTALVSLLPKTVIENLQSRYKTIYYGRIGVGEPIQNLNAIFDTTTDVTVLINRRGFNGKPIPRFQCKKSQTCSHPNAAVDGEFNYRQRTLIGNPTRDDFLISNTTIKNQYFYVVNASQTLPFDADKYQALIGLGLRDRDRHEGDSVKPIYESMFEQKSIARPIFAVILRSTERHRPNEGEIIFGERIAALYRGNLSVQSTVDSGKWSIKVDKLRTSTGSTIAENFIGEIDTGSVFILAPTEAVQRLLDVFNVTLRPLFDEKLIDCERANSLPKLDFTVSGKRFTVNPRNYILRWPADTSESGDLGMGKICVLAVKPTDGDRWILGSAFMRRLYIEFDFGEKKISIANLNIEKRDIKV